MNLSAAPITYEGCFATHFFTVIDQDKSKDFYVRTQLRRWYLIEVSQHTKMALDVSSSALTHPNRVSDMESARRHRISEHHRPTPQAFMLNRSKSMRFQHCGPSGKTWPEACIYSNQMCRDG